MDLRDTDTGPVQLIIGTNNSDLILPKQILKPSSHLELDRVPYAVETPLGWAVTNWLPGERRVASPYNGFKVYERLVFTSDGVVVGVVIRRVERYDLVKIKPTESEAEH